MCTDLVLVTSWNQNLLHPDSKPFLGKETKEWLDQWGQPLRIFALIFNAAVQRNVH